MKDPEAAKVLTEATKAEDPTARLWAAAAMGEAGGEGFDMPLALLLGDSSLDVRRAAIAATAKVRSPGLWPRVAEALSEPALAGLAARALATGGPSALPSLVALFGREGRPEVRGRLARVLGRLGGEEAAAALKAGLGEDEESVRHEALRALVGCRYRAREGDLQEFHTLIAAEVKDAAGTLAALVDLEGTEGLDLVRRALASELDGNRERILMLLSLLYDPSALQRVREHWSDLAKDKRAYALEVLEMTLPSELRREIVPLFENAESRRGARGLEEGAEGRRSPLERLRLVAGKTERWARPWTQAATLYEGARLGYDLSRELEGAQDSSRSALVVETAEAMRNVLSGNARNREKHMLTIERVITLKAVDMFQRASEEVLTEVAGILEEVEAHAGDVIFEKGAAGDSMYIIVSGRIRVYDQERTIGELGPKDIFGELALLDPEPRIASIAAISDAKLLRLDREAFAELMAANIEIVRGVLHVLCGRLREREARARGAA